MTWRSFRLPAKAENAAAAGATDLTELRETIEHLFAEPPGEYLPAHRELFERFKEALNRGAVRAAEPNPAVPAGWRVNAWVKQGLLLGFRLGGIVDMSVGSLPFF